VKKSAKAICQVDDLFVHFDEDAMVFEWVPYCIGMTILLQNGNKKW
jgi:hypothetical protein